MMVVDTSALVALLENEPEANLIERTLAESESTLVSTASALETSLVLEHRFGPPGVQHFDALVRDVELELVPFDESQFGIARAAFQRFGRGRHPAKLNFGDCFAYALAKSRSLPLLFKGGDFAQTDIESVL